MDKIEWMQKKYTQKPDSADVRVKISGNYMHIVFYDGSYAKITNRDYISCGMTADRVYFRESRNGTGFKLGRDSNTRNKLIRLPGKFPGLVGFYKLQYDSYEKLWFIAKGATI